MLEIKIKTDIRVCELDDGTYIMSKASIVNRIRKETNPKNTKTKLTPYAVQKQLSEKYSIPEDTINIDLERKIEIIKGFSLAKTKNWTVVDDIIHNHKKYDSTDHFEVMWLDEKESASNYRGSIGHKITRRKGIVLSYPNEL